MKKIYLILMLIIALPFCAYSVEFEAGYYKGVCVKTMIFDNVGFEVFGSMGITGMSANLDYITYGISPLILKVYDNDTARISIALQYRYDSTERIINNIYGIVLPRVEYRIPCFDSVWVRIFEMNIDYKSISSLDNETVTEKRFISSISLLSGVMFVF